MTSTFREIDLQELLVSESNVRALMVENMEGIDMVELRESVKEHGIIEPLVVTKGVGDKYNVIAGRRRLMALNGIHGKKSYAVPCMVVEGAEAVDEWTLSASENKARRNLTPEEWKETIDTGKKMGLNQTEIARRLGVAKSTVSAMASGKSWTDLKKPVTTAKAQPKSLEPTRFEHVECPSCGVYFNATVDGNGLTLEIANQDNTDRPAKRRKN